MTGIQKNDEGFLRRIPRWTLSRETVLALLSRTSQHMSAKEIHSTLLKNFPGIGLCTVYRPLSFLFREGFINKLDMVEGPCRYEYKAGKENSRHHHVICIKCGKIVDFDDFTNEAADLFREAEANIEKKYKFTIRDYNIEFFGTCENCR